MRYIVHTRATIQTINPLESYVILSISDSDTPHPPVPENDRCRGILRVIFDDMDYGSADIERATVLFDDNLAREILDFWEQHRDVQTFYVHCNAGHSRSPAVAAALMRIDGQDDDVWFRQKTPNRLVYRTLLEIWMTERNDEN